ncbi:DUF2510 domain-containing protein [Rhodococcus aetherivorans]
MSAVCLIVARFGALAFCDENPSSCGGKDIGHLSTMSRTSRYARATAEQLLGIVELDTREASAPLEDFTSSTRNYIVTKTATGHPCRGHVRLTPNLHRRKDSTDARRIESRRHRFTGPGYYPDPSGVMRWWNGVQWTERVQNSGPPPPIPQPLKKSHTVRKILLALVAVSVLVVAGHDVVDTSARG